MSLLSAGIFFAVVAAHGPAGGRPRLAAYAGNTVVGISGTSFTINTQQTFTGTKLAGQLPNVRMIQAAFDDANPATVGNWVYPDTGVWDPARNTNEFAAAVPSYAAAGLRAVTIGMQGGEPIHGATSQPWIVTAFNPDGSLNPAWLSRIDQAVTVTDNNGMVVILSLFYQAQSKNLSSFAAMQNAVTNTVNWVLAQGYTNVLLEIANEVNVKYWKWLTTSNVAQLITQAQSESGGRLKVSVSWASSSIPNASVLGVEDYITIHSGSLTPAKLASRIAQIRATPQYQAWPRPIIVNEGGTNLSAMNAAISNGVSWGYSDDGLNDYWDGFQSPPINWTINTTTKQAFFSSLANLTQPSPSPSPSGTPSPSPSPSPTPSPSPSPSPSGTPSPSPSDSPTVSPTPT